MAIKESDSLKTKLEKIARAFNEPPHTILPIAPTKPDSPNDPISLPPSVIMEVINPTNPQEIVGGRVDSLKAFTTSDNSESPLTKPQNPKSSKPSLTKQKEESIVQEVETQPLLERVENVEQQPTKRGRGRPKGSKNKKTIMLEKLSQAQEESGEPDPDLLAQHSMNGDFRGETKKFSRKEKPSHEILPVNLRVEQFTSVKGKTSLCYALLYAQALTPVQVDQLLFKADPLKLTTAEVIALKLLQRTGEGDPKAEKIYWEILKNEQKNAKITPVKGENSLLDEALEKAESAILGEVVVDNETNPWYNRGTTFGKRVRTPVKGNAD